MQDQYENQNEFNYTIHYVLYGVLLIVIATLTFLLLQSDAPKTENTAVTKSIKFTDLPQYVQDRYILKSEYSALELTLDKTQKMLETLKDQQANTPVVIEEPKKQEVVESVKEEAQKIETLSSIEKSKDFAKCYDMKEGDYIISYKCQKEIEKFVDTNKDATYFEIIGIVDTVEFKLYKSLQNNTFIYENLGVTDHTIERMKQFSEAGLAKQRAVEASWVIKAHTKRQAKTYNPHYHLISESGKRGVIIRAYK